MGFRVYPQEQIRRLFEIQLIFEKDKQEKRLVASYQKGEVIFEGYMQMKSDSETARKENPSDSKSNNKPTTNFSGR